jgi:hypothetical protein
MAAKKILGELSPSDELKVAVDLLAYVGNRIYDGFVYGKEPDVISLQYGRAETSVEDTGPLPSSKDTDPASGDTASTTLPAGFMPFCDQASGIGLYVPDTWRTDIQQPGSFAIVQSFEPETESPMGGLAPGQTKCDLIILDPQTNISHEIEQARQDDSGINTSDREMVLTSGETAVRIESEGPMGNIVSFYTAVGGCGMVMHCYGDFTQVDDIAGTIGPCD